MPAVNYQYEKRQKELEKKKKKAEKERRKEIKEEYQQGKRDSAPRHPSREIKFAHLTSEFASRKTRRSLY